MSDLTTFPVAWIIETIGEQYGVNLLTDGIDDECFGCAFGTDSSLDQFIVAHKGLYNYQPFDTVDDNGVPVTILKRRAVGDDLMIDLEVDESECIMRDQAQPVIRYTRVDPLSLPRAVELSYIDPDRGYAVNTQPATFHAASLQHGKLTL